MRVQTRSEERLNAWSHSIGVLFGLAALPALVIFDRGRTPFSLFSVTVYGISVILLFAVSSCYHAIDDPKLKRLFRILDHISIYVLIAGTYTPVLLITLEGGSGWSLFWLFGAWCCSERF